jgi:hypothetical protein
MNLLLRKTLEALNLSEEDFKRGVKDVPIRTIAGAEVIVRLTMISRHLIEPVLRRYMATEDGRTLVRPMLAPEFARDDFLDTIPPCEVAKLANTAIGLCFGPNGLEHLVNQGISRSSGQQSNSEATDPPTIR